MKFAFIDISGCILKVIFKLKFLDNKIQLKGLHQRVEKERGMLKLIIIIIHKIHNNNYVFINVH